MFSSFQKAISQSPECGEYYFLLGKLYWDMGEATRNDRSKVHTNLLKVCPIVAYIITASRFYLVSVIKPLYILGCKIGPKLWLCFPLSWTLLRGGGL